MFNFERFPILSSKRLTLKEITPADAKSVYALRSDYQVTHFNNARPYTVLQQAYDLIVSFREDYKKKQTIRWGVTLSGDQNVIGIIGYNYWYKVDMRASVGYDLAKRFWNQGYATEALRLVVAFGFREMLLNRIEAECIGYNKASMRVLQKLGFEREGRQQEKIYQGGEFHDLVLFALLHRAYGRRTQANDKGL